MADHFGVTRITDTCLLPGGFRNGRMDDPIHQLSNREFKRMADELKRRLARYRRGTLTRHPRNPFNGMMQHIHRARPIARCRGIKDRANLQGSSQFSAGKDLRITDHERSAPLKDLGISQSLQDDFRADPCGIAQGNGEDRSAQTDAGGRIKRG